MRFEIRAGGALLILVGLAGLSGVVFALGLWAGYGVARQANPEAAQAANVYPLPSPPEAAASVAASPIAPAAPEQPALAKPAPAPSIAAAKPTASPAVAPPQHTIAKATAPSPAVAKPSSRQAAAADAGEATDEVPATVPNAASISPKVVSASVPSPAHRKRFNVQIDAVMDRSNADQMASRLQKLGYHAFLAPTDIGGATWWRVRVGPYQSQEDATAAEQELRERYRAAFSGLE